MLNTKIKIQEIKEGDYGWIKKLFNRRWGSDFIVTRGRVYTIDKLNGYIAKVDNKRVGLITYKIRKDELEIVSLDSLLQKRGVGTKLVKKVIDMAREKN